MGLQSLIKKAAGVAFRAAGDLIPEVQYKTLGTPGYNTETGTVTSSGTTVTIKQGIVIVDQELADVPASSVAAHHPGNKPPVKEAYLLQSKINFEPTVGDEITIASGVVYRVKHSTQDPAGATWKLILEYKV